MKKYFFIFCLFLLFTLVSANDGYRRLFNIDILHYEFDLRINDSTDYIEGRTVIDLKLMTATDSVAFDLTGFKSDGTGMIVSDITMKGEAVKWRQGREKLSVFFKGIAQVNDTLELVIKYRGIPSDGLIISRNRYGDRTFFADHWPDRAHNYLPCTDHPYDKATVDFFITAPVSYSVVANGFLLEESAMDGNQKLTHWSESVPLPVKVMAFGAARFAVQYSGEVNNIPVWSWVFPQNKKEGFFDYSIASKPLDFYCKLIGPYPYKKLANVQSKTIYGGLENAGAIFYSENSVTGLGKDEGLIAHEIAHQWFGDCVTEADWHHVWLSEGFATYLTSLYFESVRGEEWLEEDMARKRSRIISGYSAKTGPVIDTTITNLMDLLSVNSYQKGAWVLHMLRNEVGDSLFTKGLRLFYERYKLLNVLTGDFQQTMEDVSGRELGTFFHQWLYIAGQPELRISYKKNKKAGTTEVSIEQLQKNIFKFRLDLLIKDLSGERLVSASVNERLTKFVLPSLDAVEITPDPHVKLLFKAAE